MYNVVIEYTAAAGGYAGNRFWTSYKNQDAFKRAKVEEDPRHRVIAVGVSNEKAIELTAMTPESSRLGAALQELEPALGLAPKKFKKIARFHLQNAAFAIASDRQMRGSAAHRQDSVDETTDEE